MLATADMNETISFYESVLGFTPTVQSAEYSILERDGKPSTSRRPNPKRL